MGRRKLLSRVPCASPPGGARATFTFEAYETLVAPQHIVQILGEPAGVEDIDFEIPTGPAPFRNSLIGATARVNDLTLVPRIVADFTAILASLSRTRGTIPPPGGHLAPTDR